MALPKCQALFTCLVIADHPNLLCFVSHAGFNSVLEVTKSGKPSILVPIFGDQFRNARLVEAKNTTVIMFKEKFNNGTFEAALRQALSDQSLAARAKRLASLMNNKPFPVKERLISTVEFSVRHGKIENLDSYGRNLNTLQYYSIDVIAFLSLIMIISTVITVKVCSICVRSIFLRKDKVKKNKSD
ncbi:hypothetical protein OESDEN_12805 [Oesophagostomum dentatum]|uniref:glucuronosyltransferase n=1 Tax=Oesophagostomum dentatum TaxID=61180 RepID=A0A0B1SQ15_OESDE|nr:hypothetical protein OESDEN_12805 [Oesophagostomum dentatum]